MKKLVISSLLIVLSVVAFAQDGLKGKWNMKQSMMGITVADNLEFSGDTDGKVVRTFTIDMNMNMLGTKTTGAAKGTVEGTFTYADGKIVMIWDLDTYKYGMTKQIVTTYKGVTVADDGSMKEIFDEASKELEDDIKDDPKEVFLDVKISSDKLTVKEVDPDGSKETFKYIRVQ